MFPQTKTKRGGSYLDKANFQNTNDDQASKEMFRNLSLVEDERRYLKFRLRTGLIELHGRITDGNKGLAKKGLALMNVGLSLFMRSAVLGANSEMFIVGAMKYWDIRQIYLSIHFLGCFCSFIFSLERTLE